jgi:hypothetical protein
MAAEGEVSAVTAASPVPGSATTGPAGWRPAAARLEAAGQRDGGAAEFELAFWESIKESSDPAEFAAYLERYPGGTFTALAESRRQVLLDEATAPSLQAAAADLEVSAVELTFWDSVKESSNAEMYSAYLERYPDGAFASLAKVRLEELESRSP